MVMDKEAKHIAYCPIFLVSGMVSQHAEDMLRVKHGTERGVALQLGATFSTQISDIDDGMLVFVFGLLLQTCAKTGCWVRVQIVRHL